VDHPWPTETLKLFRVSLVQRDTEGKSEVRAPLSVVETVSMEAVAVKAAVETVSVEAVSVMSAMKTVSAEAVVEAVSVMSAMKTVSVQTVVEAVPVVSAMETVPSEAVSPGSPVNASHKHHTREPHQRKHFHRHAPRGTDTSLRPELRPRGSRQIKKPERASRSAKYLYPRAPLPPSDPTECAYVRRARPARHPQTYFR